MNQKSSPSRLVPKLLYVLSVTFIIATTYFLFSQKWAMPYLYVMAYPIIIPFRLSHFWKMKWQYFLFDFCYFSNAFLYVFLLFYPDDRFMFAILFGMASGPMLWSIALFRNSLVLHSADKMTSIFIHIVPALVSFCIRWDPVATSQFWFTNFLIDFRLSSSDSWYWIFGIPCGSFVIHSIIYTIIVYYVIQPSEEYLHSYRLLSTKSPFAGFINMFGPNWKIILYHFLYWTYGVYGCLLAVLCYNYFVVHLSVITFVCLVGIWNGACYNIDVFGQTSKNNK